MITWGWLMYPPPHTVTNLCVCILRTFEIDFLSKCLVYNTVLLTLITVLCNRSPELTHLFFQWKKDLHWYITALQCCVPFYCTAIWICSVCVCMCLYIYIFPLSWASLPPHPQSSHLGHHRAPSWAPCATYTSFLLAIYFTYYSS